MRRVAMMVAAFAVLSSAATPRAQDARGLLANADDELGVAFTVTGGFGYVDMGQFDAGVQAYFDQLDMQVEGFDATPRTSHLLRAIGLRAQLRLPRYITIETGIDYMSQDAATPISIGTADGEISYENIAFSLPVMVGAHLPLHRRVGAFGSIGPVLILSGRSSWEYSFGQVSSFRGKIGGGFEAAAGAEITIVWRLRATATTRYRFAKSGALSTDGPALPPLQPVEELGWSGVSGELGVRIVLD